MPPGGPYLGALDAAGIAAIVTAWRGGQARSSPLGWAAAAFVAVGLLSLIPSPYSPPSWHPRVLVGLAQAFPGVESWPALYTWRAAADLVLGWGLFVAVRRAFADGSIRPLALGLAGGLAVVTAFGIATELGLVDLGAYRPTVGARISVRRSASLFFLSGWFAQYLVLATPLSVAAIAASARLRRLALPLTALALACLALTRQRAGWLAAVVQAALWALLVGRLAPLRKRQLWLAAAVVALGISLAIALQIRTVGSAGPLIERARSISSGVAPRVPLWRAAVGMLAERPASGWGLGSFAPVYDQFHPRAAPDSRKHRETAHSLYLHVAAERGLVGLATLALLGWAAVVSIRRPLPGQESMALALGLTLAGIAFYGLVQYLFYIRSIAWLIWILLGCAAVIARPGPSEIPARAGPVLVAIALLLVPFRIVAGDPPDLSGNREFGFREAELEHQWTGGFAARRLDRRGDALVLEVANGHPKAGARPVEVTIGIDGVARARLTLRGGWERHQFELGPEHPRATLLTIRARPTFRPFSDYRDFPDLRRSTDIRSLGVAVRGIGWDALPEELAGNDPAAVGSQ